MFTPLLLTLIGLVVAIIVIVALIVLAIRRRAASEVQPPPELSEPIDYTSLPIDEPTSTMDRLRNASLATKLLLALIVLALIGGIAVLYYGFVEPAQVANTPDQPAATISEVSATVVAANRIAVEGATTLPDGATVNALLQNGDQTFAWFDPQSATTQVSGGRVRLVLSKLADGPLPDAGQTYSVVLEGSASNGQTARSEPAQLDVPTPVAAAFFQTTSSAQQPTTESVEPTTAAPTTQAATAPPAATAQPTTAPTVATTVLSATVFNGGNVRGQPNLQGEVLDQVNANESVTLLQKTQNGAWYQITNVRGITGWVSVSLLRIDSATAARVPVGQ